MRLRGAAAVGAVALTLSGCGGAADGQREQTAGYLRDVNLATAQFTREYDRAARALAAFSTKDLGGPETARRLAETAVALRKARASVARLHPPEAARGLHTDILRLLELQAAIAHELGVTATYLPAAEKALGSAQRAVATLQSTLQHQQSAAEQAAALRVFANALEHSSNALGRLRAPPVLQPRHVNELNRLRSSRRVVLALAAAVEQGDREATNRALERFRADPEQAAAVTKEVAAAIRAFNRRLAAQRRLLERIDAERKRLDRELR